MDLGECRKVLACGHRCAGYKNEQTHTPCLKPGCWNGQESITGEDICVVCYDPLAAYPVIQISCGHMLHRHCAENILKNRWTGPRITFTFMLCPVCRAEVEHPALQHLLEPLRKIYDDIKRKALTRLQYEGLEKKRHIGPHYSDNVQYALYRYCYYPCYKCQTPYFGGTAQCEGGMDEKLIKAEEMICPTCSAPKGKAQSCTVHGTDYIEFKCRYCCSVAVYFCFGTTHFCDSCHTNHTKMTSMGSNLPRCPAGPAGQQLTGSCPLGIEHPPNGQEHCLGCGLCANIESF